MSAATGDVDVLVDKAGGDGAPAGVYGIKWNTGQFYLPVYEGYFIICQQNVVHAEMLRRV